MCLLLLTNCEGLLGLDDFREADPLVAAGGGSDGDGGGGGVGGAGAGGDEPTIGPGDPPVPHLTWAAVMAGDPAVASGDPLTKAVTVEDLVVSADGTVTVCGSFAGQMRFDELEPSSRGASDIYVTSMPAAMKTDSPGAQPPTFFAQFGDEAAQTCRSLALAADSHVLLTGTIEGLVDFGGSAPLLPDVGRKRAYVAKLDDQGLGAEAFELAGSGNHDGRAIASYRGVGVDGLLVAGGFKTSLERGASSLDTGDAQPAAFAGRFDTSEGAWLYGIGTEDHATEQRITDVAIDASGSAVIVGWTNGNCTTTTGEQLQVDGEGALVAKLDANGVEDWVFQADGPADDEATAVAVDSTGSVIVVGKFQETLSFATQQLTGHGPEDSDGFIIKLDSQGEVDWARALSGAGDQEALEVTVDGNDNVYVVGAFDGSITFQHGAISAQGKDGFFVVFDREGKELLGQTCSGPGDVAITTVAPDPSTGGVIMGVEFDDSYVDMITRRITAESGSPGVVLARVDWIR